LLVLLSCVLPLTYQNSCVGGGCGGVGGSGVGGSVVFFVLSRDRDAWLVQYETGLYQNNGKTKFVKREGGVPREYASMCGIDKKSFWETQRWFVKRGTLGLGTGCDMYSRGQCSRVR